MSSIDKIKKGDTQIRTGDKSFAGSCLTTWPCRLTSFLYNKKDIVKSQLLTKSKKYSIIKTGGMKYVE